MKTFGQLFYEEVKKVTLKDFFNSNIRLDKGSVFNLYSTFSKESFDIVIEDTLMWQLDFKKSKIFRRYANCEISAVICRVWDNELIFTIHIEG